MLTQPLKTSKVQKFDPDWSQIRDQAKLLVQQEPVLTDFVTRNVLDHSSLEAAIIHRLSARLGHEAIPAQTLSSTFLDVLYHCPELGDIFRADLNAVLDRDPACSRLIEPLLYFKGFHAIQTHRFAHYLWHNKAQDFALYLQGRSSEIFQTDIHPAAKFGRGLFFDHATGLVIGSTASVGDNVSMLQNVTLGGTGKQTGDRHPKIRNGVLIGAGSKILGNIEVGEGARVAAGSVVLQPVKPHTTVAGVPAKAIGAVQSSDEPGCTMDQIPTVIELSYDI